MGSTFLPLFPRKTVSKCNNQWGFRWRLCSVFFNKFNMLLSATVAECRAWAPAPHVFISRHPEDVRTGQGQLALSTEQGHNLTKGLYNYPPTTPLHSSNSHTEFFNVNHTTFLLPRLCSTKHNLKWTTRPSLTLNEPQDLLSAKIINIKTWKDTRTVCTHSQIKCND